MSALYTLITNLKAGSLKEFLESLKNADLRPKVSSHWSYTNEIRPADLYCYLAARFGAPNGMQNLLRRNSSDNLIHWEWLLRCGSGWITIQGLSFRTEVAVYGTDTPSLEDSPEFAVQIKRHFKACGAKMSAVRQSLELWEEFVNPYTRIRVAIDKLQKELDDLHLEPNTDTVPELNDMRREIRENAIELGGRYLKGFGLCFGIRAMLPVMAEAFVNLVLYVFMKPSIRKNERIRESLFRANIDVRVMGLHHNCDGFAQEVDYASHDACKGYRSLVNERNDLLHGNVDVKKLKFNEVYFSGTVPIFKEYKSLWERTYGLEIDAVGLKQLAQETKAVDDFVQYVVSCIEPRFRNSIEALMFARHLGYRPDTGSVGVLFSGVLTDMRMPDPGEIIPEQ